MNKKFSTLMVAALLTAWGGTNRMYAQEPGGDATATETPASVCDFAGESIALAGIWTIRPRLFRQDWLKKER